MLQWTLEDVKVKEYQEFSTRAPGVIGVKLRKDKSYWAFKDFSL